MVREKSAFTLIELIFAIVVIGISVVSLPMMNQAIAKGVDANIVQEAIFAAATELNEAVTAHWDENSLEPGKPASFARVIDSGLCENNPLLATFRQMPGHINQLKHRRCLDNNNTSPADNTALIAVNALEDSVHGNINIFILNIKNKTGYKETYTSDVAVTRVNVTFNGVFDTDMKKITITVTSSRGQKVILKTYSANIGEIDYHHKTL